MVKLMFMNHSQRNHILMVLFLGVLMGAIDIAIVGPALPSIGIYFQVDGRLLAWIFNIYVLFFMIGTPLMAKLSDSYGRRSIYLLDVILFAVGSAITAFGPSFEFVLMGRAVQGLGAGGIFPVASAFIGDTFPAEKRGSALGIIGAVFGLSFIIGPILGGILINFGWQWLFLINLPVAVIIIILATRYLPKVKKKRNSGFDWKGMALLGLAIASLAIGINQIDTNQLIGSFCSWKVWPFLLTSFILLPVFWKVEKESKDPIIRPDLFKSREVTLTSFISIFSGITESGLVFIPSMAMVALGLTNSQASFMLMPVVVTMSIGSPIIGRILDRTGSKKLMIIGGIILILGFIIMGIGASNFVYFIISGAMIGFGLSSLLGAPVRYIMLNETRKSERASGQALININTSMGQLIGGALVGAFIASQGMGLAGYQAAYIFIGLLAILMVLLAFGLKNKVDEQTII